MSQITVSNLTFQYDGSYDNIFENVSFQIDTDWRLGLVGRNGRGKTTFLNLLRGEYEFGGRISTDTEFFYFPFTVQNVSAPAIEAVLETIPDAQEWQLLREAAKLDIGDDVLYRPFNTLSNGERTKLLLAAMFLKGNSFPLIDEPTNHLDEAGRELLGHYLSKKSGFILVSHDRRFLDVCTDYTLAVNRENIELIRGSFSTWFDEKARRDESERAENLRLKTESARLTEAARRTAGWSNKIERSKIGEHAGDRGFIGHKSAKMMKRAKNIEARQLEAAEEKSKLMKNIEEAEDLKLYPLSYHSARIAQLRDVTIKYAGVPAAADVSFEIMRGDRIVLRGKNGSGKSSILKLLLGQHLEYDGGFTVALGLKISYVPQDTSELSGAITDFEEQHGLDPALFRAILRKLDFSRVQFEKDLSDYSGGQKKKVLIAKSLCESAHLYIWDEPLNFIDVFSRMQIETLLMRFEPTIIFVEHDAAFADNIATKIVHLGDTPS